MEVRLPVDSEHKHFNKSPPLLKCQACTAGVRLGAYSPVKALLSRGDESSSLLRNLTAGCISGAVAAAATNPLDLIKACACSYVML